MKNFAKLPYFIFISFIVLFFACNQSNGPKSNKETILKGSTTILVDETLKPIVEDQIEVFESRYEAKIKLDAKSESEVIRAFVKDTASIAVLSRTLTNEEMKVFDNKKIAPKVTKFAIDAIAFITTKNDNDTLIALQDVIAFMNGNYKGTAIKGLVFDNPNSSTVRYMNTLAGLKSIPQKGVFSFKTNDEVIKEGYVLYDMKFEGLPAEQAAMMGDMETKITFKDKKVLTEMTSMMFTNQTAVDDLGMTIPKTTIPKNFIEKSLYR